MPADDHPFDALRRQTEIEAATTSPIGRIVVSAASSWPVGWPLDAAIERIRF